jgi:hypothetical protein
MQWANKTALYDMMKNLEISEWSTSILLPQQIFVVCSFEQFCKLKHCLPYRIDSLQHVAPAYYNEMARWVRLTYHFAPGRLLRIHKSGRYRGDLAVVVSHPRADSWITVACVPRDKFPGKRKRGGKGAPQYYFDVEDYRRSHFLAVTEQGDSSVIIPGHRIFKNGLEYLMLSPDDIIIEASPPMQEILSLFHIPELKNIMTESIARAFKRTWNTGNRVYATSGPFSNSSGNFVSFSGYEKALVQFDSMDTPTLCFVENLERIFQISQEVRVAWGLNEGRSGTIVQFHEVDERTLVELVTTDHNPNETVSKIIYPYRFRQNLMPLF